MIIKTPPRITNKRSLLKYIEIDLWSWLRDLYGGLFKLTLTENFQSFTASNVLIPAGQEVTIPNGFRRSYPGLIPNGRVIIRQQGDANIIDGVSSWNASFVYLQNPSANDATITVIFFI